MASRIGMSYRNERANARIETALETLASQADVEVPASPAYQRDAVRQETARLERLADVLEAIVAVRDAHDDTPPVPVDLTTLTRSELDALATEQGIENPEAFANKGEVIVAIEALDEA